MLLIDKILFFLQTPQSPTTAPSINQANPINSQNIDVQTLIKQLEFVQYSHEQLANTFDTYINSYHYSFQFFLGALGAILALLTVVGVILVKNAINQSLKQTTEKIRRETEIELEKIKRESIETITQDAKKRESYFRTILDRESVIDEVEVLYLLLDPGISSAQCLEYKILQARGFKPAVHKSLDNSRLAQFNNSVIVLDLENRPTNFSESETITKIENNFPSNSALVFYYRGFSDAIDQFKKNNKVKYYHVANGAISLVGAVVDAAYVIKALQDN